ncbi:MAG: LCP family protein [Tissierellia bacterium]|nr:LCP family protein [Tissierellia bacterium]
MKKKFWTTFLISLIVFSTIYGFIGNYILKKDLSYSADNSQEDQEQVEEEEAKGEILFLLIGIDDMEGVGGVKRVKELEEDENGYKSTGMRSDTIILCKFNYETGEISMLSIPRDTRTNIRGRRYQEKINHAYSYGGPQLLVQTVKDLLKVDLEYYVTVDYQAVSEIVDAIGGVEIEVPQRMRYKDLAAKPPLIIDLQPGLQTLTGAKSLEFLRFRSYPDGDLGRIAAQQYFLKEFIKQALTPKNIIKIPKMIKTYFDYVDTNIPLSAALKVVPSLDNISMDNLNVVRLEGETPIINGQSYFIPYEDQKEQLVMEVFGNFVLGTDRE